MGRAHPEFNLGFVYPVMWHISRLEIISTIQVPKDLGDEQGRGGGGGE